VGQLLADLRVTCRSLLKARAFSAVVILTLALGIGTNTAIFSFIYGILLRPFAYAAPDELVRVITVLDKEAGREVGSSLLDVEDWERQSRHLSAIGAYTDFDADARGDGPAQPIRMTQLNAGALVALGVQPLVGRLFTADEDRTGGNVFVALISHGLWQSRFGSAPDILGKTLDTSIGRFTVIGVMPRGFAFPERSDAWTPMESWFAQQVGERRNRLRHHRIYRVIARLGPGRSLSEAAADLDSVAASLEQAFPKENAGVRIRVRGLREAVTGDLVPYLRMVSAAALFVLLICCFNVAGLLVTRALSFRREFALRAALGASRARLIQAALAESFVLSVIGGVLGVLLAVASVRALLGLIPVALPTWMQIEVDPAALAFALVATMVTALLCGLLAALFAARADLNTVLKDDARTSTGSGRRLRSVLIVSQVSLTLLLLVGASLLTETFVRLRTQDTGFAADGLIVVRATNYRTGTRQEQAAALSQFHERVLERLRAVPGVTAAGGTNVLPYTRSTHERGRAQLQIRGATAEDTRLQLPLSGSDVSPGYLETMGIQLVSGRAIDSRDTTDSPMVVLVNERAAKALWPDRDPIGQEVYWGADAPSPSNPYCTVVGVVRNVRHLAGERDDGLEFYYPYTQYPITNIYYVVRAQGHPLSLIPSLREAVQSVDRNAAIVFAKPFDQLIDESLWQRRLWSVLLSAFSMLSLTLVAVGLYGLLSYVVAQQRREIGVRMAMGALPGTILTLVLGYGARLLVAGCLIGLIGAVVLGRLLATMLFGVSAGNPVTLAGAVALLAVVALVACYLPARRASAVDPIVALRDS
jgi:putative ABC transport system permease protein